MPGVDNLLEIREVIGKYLLGCQLGDLALLKEVFHPDAWMYGLKADGSRGDFPLTRMMEMLAEHPSGEAHRVEIMSISAYPEAAAVVVAEDGYHGMAYIDHFALTKLDGAWVIVNKVYQRVLG